MEYGFSILMFIFSGAILLYAALLALTKDYRMLPYRSRVSVKPKDPKRYTARLAGVIALVSAAPALSGLAAFWNPISAVAVFIGSMVFFLWIGTKMMKGVN